ncbi:MAG: hypothetical protein ACRBCK_05265 [Alphaproteobacteria bacterium]
MHVLTVLANVALIILAIFLFSEAYGAERYMALLLAVPPVLSLLAIRRGGDKEERLLKKRIRKAKLRQELKDLAEFDKTE